MSRRTRMLFDDYAAERERFKQLIESWVANGQLSRLLDTIEAASAMAVLDSTLREVMAIIQETPGDQRTHLYMVRVLNALLSPLPDLLIDYSQGGNVSGTA